MIDPETAMALLEQHGPGAMIGIAGVGWGLMQRSDLRGKEKAWDEERKAMQERSERISERYADAIGPLTREMAKVGGFLDSLRLSIVGLVRP